MSTIENIAELAAAIQSGQYDAVNRQMMIDCITDYLEVCEDPELFRMVRFILDTNASIREAVREAAWGQR